MRFEDLIKKMALSHVANKQAQFKKNPEMSENLIICLQDYKTIVNHKSKLTYLHKLMA